MDAVAADAPPPTILVVEDDPRIGRLLRHTLEAEGFTAVVAPTGEEGINYALREVREEIGCAIQIRRLVGGYSKPRKREVVLAFLCALAPGSPEPATSEEVSEVAWFVPPEFPADLLPKHRQRLEDALLDRAEAIVRAQLTSTEDDQRRPAER